MPTRRRVLALLVSLPACRPRAAASPTLRSGAAGPVLGGVASYVSSPWSFSTVNWLIAAPQGTVMVDTQFLPSAALESAALARARTGRAVTDAIVLHPNPDKFNGTAALQAAGARVHTSAQVRFEIPAVHAQRKAAFFDRYAPDYPEAVPEPTSFGTRTTTLSLGGTDIVAHVLGAGCSHTHVVAVWQDHAFVGDLVTPGAHAWLELGLVDAWLARLGEIEALQPKWVHCGRGTSGGAECIALQRAYLEHARECVAAEKPAGPPRRDAIERARQAILRRHPDHRFAVFLNIGLPALWRELAAESGDSP